MESSYTYMENNTHPTASPFLVWFALLISVGALIFALVAYNRTSLDAQAELQQQYEETTSQLNVKTARLQALAELSLIEMRQTATRNYAEFNQQVSAIKEDLEEAYVQAQMDTSEEWQAINQQFATLSSEIRAETADSLDSLRRLIEGLAQS
jgi:hypothetical protein